MARKVPRSARSVRLVSMRQGNVRWRESVRAGLRRQRLAGRGYPTSGIAPRDFRFGRAQSSDGSASHPLHRPRGGCRQRHHRYRLLDHAGAGARVCLRAQGSHPDHGGRSRDGEPLPHPGMVARGRLAGRCRLCGDWNSGGHARRPHDAGPAAACRRSGDRRVPSGDDPRTPLAGRPPRQSAAPPPGGCRRQLSAS